jgi:hypothetical protein
MAKKRRRAAKHTAETATIVSIALGIGTVVAGIAIYDWIKKPAVATTGTPAQITPTGSGVATALAPS